MGSALLLVLIAIQIIGLPPADGSSEKSTVDVARSFGYALDVHEVVTSDGYILTLHRLPPYANSAYSKQSNSSHNVKDIKVVLFLGCLTCTSAVYLLEGPRNSIPFFLSDLGYDSWLANFRGTTDAKRHLSLNASDPAFWDFSIDDMASKDAPAIVKYVLEKTMAPKVHIFTYSMGSLVFLTMISNFPYLQDKFYSAVALAPGVFVNHMVGPGRQVLNFIHNIHRWLITHTSGEVFQRQSERDNFVYNFCANIFTLCNAFIIAISGLNNGNIDKSTMIEYMFHYPGGTSVRTVHQYYQKLTAEHLPMYDFGYSENYRRYGQPTPPLYDISNVTVPIAIFWGQNDFLVHPKDITKLIRRLPSVVVQVMLPEYNHVDVAIGRDIKKLYFKKVAKFYEFFGR